jgi:hypothetical protein
MIIKPLTIAFVTEAPPNQRAALDAAGALGLQLNAPWRRASEPGRWAEALS